MFYLNRVAFRLWSLMPLTAKNRPFYQNKQAETESNTELVIHLNNPIYKSKPTGSEKR